jgi:hypothetical protein
MLKWRRWMMMISIKEIEKKTKIRNKNLALINLTTKSKNFWNLFRRQM